jgi:hypothetical protein
MIESDSGDTREHATSEHARRHALQTYQLLYVAQQDLSQAAFFCDHLLHKGWAREPWQGRWQTYLHQGAYVTAMVVAYCRPFTVSRGWPKFPTRLLQLNADEKILHQQLLDLRNAVYAHSDVEARKIRPIAFGGLPTAIEVLPSMRFPLERLQAIRQMIRLVSVNIQARLEELSPSLVHRD